MATTGVMADFARMPTSRKVLVFVVIGFFLGFIYYRFVFKKLESDLVAARAQREQLAALNKKLGGDVDKYPALKQDYDRVQRCNRANQRALPTAAEVSEFLETLARKVRESGVETKKWTPMPDEKVDEFIKVPLDVEITGTFMQLKRFFASLVPAKTFDCMAATDDVQARDRIVSIENLVIKEPIVRNREVVLTARFRAVTFRLENTAPVTLPNAVTPDAAAPAGTPAGAKARTDDALKKQDDKNRAAADQGGP